MDMANDLSDQVQADFAAYRSAHKGEWDTLLKYGLAVDPTDGKFHSLFHPILKNGQWTVYGVFPGGPADQAGLKPQDLILSVNGSMANNLTFEQLVEMTNAPSYVLMVQRPGGNVPITVHPEKYDQLIVNLAH
jgi:C-terminal processing protease CtpA/Prc